MKSLWRAAQLMNRISRDNVEHRQVKGEVTDERGASMSCGADNRVTRDLLVVVLSV